MTLYCRTNSTSTWRRATTKRGKSGWLPWLRRKPSIPWIVCHRSLVALLLALLPLPPMILNLQVVLNISCLIWVSSCSFSLIKLLLNGISFKIGLLKFKFRNYFNWLEWLNLNNSKKLSWVYNILFVYKNLKGTINQENKTYL